MFAPPPQGPKALPGGAKELPRGSKDLPKTPSRHQFHIFKLPINRKASITSMYEYMFRLEGTHTLGCSRKPDKQ